MNLEELLAAQPTASEYRSEAIILEVFHRRDWRCYSSTTYDDVHRLIERYLKRHAKLPGMVSSEVHAITPAEVMFWTEESGKEHKGGLFLNGAVLAVSTPGENVHYSLFIDDGTARRWGYPEAEGDFVYLGRILQSATETKVARRSNSNLEE